MKKAPSEKDVSRRSFLRRGLLSIGGLIALTGEAGADTDSKAKERISPGRPSDHPARHFVKGKDLAG